MKSIPVAEPVAWRWRWSETEEWQYTNEWRNVPSSATILEALYHAGLAEPERGPANFKSTTETTWYEPTRKPMSDTEIDAMVRQLPEWRSVFSHRMDIVRAVEGFHGVK